MYDCPIAVTFADVAVQSADRYGRETLFFSNPVGQLNDSIVCRRRGMDFIGVTKDKSGNMILHFLKPLAVPTGKFLALPDLSAEINFRSDSIRRWLLL